MRTIATLALLLALSACATATPGAVAPAAPGFLLGLVHGALMPFAFVGSLFSPTISIYAVPNGGHFYDFGYVLGLALFWGGSSGGARWRRRRRG